MADAEYFTVNFRRRRRLGGLKCNDIGIYFMDSLMAMWPDSQADKMKYIYLILLSDIALDEFQLSCTASR